MLLTYAMKHRFPLLHKQRTGKHFHRQSPELLEGKHILRSKLLNTLTQKKKPYQKRVVGRIELLQDSRLICFALSDRFRIHDTAVRIPQVYPSQAARSGHLDYPPDIQKRE